MKTTTRVCILFLLVFSVFFTTHAQELRLAGVEYFSYPKVKLKGNASDNRTSFDEFGFFLNYPKQLKNQKTTIINGIQYGWVKANVYEDTTAHDRSQTFHKIGYSLSVLHRVNEKIVLIGRITPTLASDFGDKLSGDDFVMQVSVMATMKFNEQSLGGVGLFYTTLLGRPLIIPGVQYQYKYQRHTFNTILPLLLNYNYKAGDKNELRIGFRAGINGATFNVSASKYPSSLAADRLNYSRTNLGPYVNYQLNRFVLVEAFGGISTRRKYQFTDINGSHYSYDSKTGAFFNIGVFITTPRLVKANSSKMIQQI